MLTDPQREFVRRAARTLQIIVGALAGGVLLFMAVTLYLASQNAQAVPAPAPATTPVVTYVSIAMAIANVIAWVFVPAVITARMRRSLIDGQASNWGMVKNMPNAAELGDVVPLAAIYQTSTIIGAALLEGAAFLACMAYMLEHQRIAIVDAGVLLVCILSQIPTVGRLEAWIENELAGIQQMRQLR